MEDPYNLDLTTPDAYAKNYGVDVEKNEHDPQYGQINLKFRHNSFQSTQLMMGLEQAKELHEKLGSVIIELEGSKPVAGITVGTVVRILVSSHADLIGRTGVVTYIMPSGSLQVDLGNEALITETKLVEVVK
jgi:hypothetical protein